MPERMSGPANETSSENLAHGQNMPGPLTGPPALNK